MKWRSVFRMIPVPVFYTERMPQGIGGQAFPFSGPFVRIRMLYKTDEGIHRHELAHVEVFWASLGLIIFLRLFKRVRIWNEARAYHRQTLYRDRHGNFLTLEVAAARLAGPAYNFGISQVKARELIVKA